MRLFRRNENSSSPNSKLKSAPPVVNFSEIELSLQEILIQTLAWKTMYNNILRLRESFVQKLIAGDELGIENRRAIVVLDAILKMPAALVEIGNRQKES